MQKKKQLAKNSTVYFHIIIVLGYKNHPNRLKSQNL